MFNARCVQIKQHLSSGFALLDLSFVCLFMRTPHGFLLLLLCCCSSSSLTKLAPGTNTLLGLFKEPSRLQVPFCQQMSVENDSPCSVTSKHYVIAVPKLIWNYFHAIVKWKQTFHISKVIDNGTLFANDTKRQNISFSMKQNQRVRKVA